MVILCYNICSECISKGILLDLVFFPLISVVLIGDDFNFRNRDNILLIYKHLVEQQIASLSLKSVYSLLNIQNIKTYNAILMTIL